MAAALTAAAAASPRRQHHHALRLGGLFCAITACFLAYSLIQERLMTLGFGPQQERFRHSLLVILVNRLVATAVAAAALAALRQPLRPAAPLGLFAVPSAANVLGSACQYEALKYVSFPLQALAKCAKTVPVMAWGLLLGGRRYGALDYACALTVTAGCALFVLTGSIAAPHLAAAALSSSSSGGGLSSSGVGDGVGSAVDGGTSALLVYGLALLGAFLLLDGLTSTAQDKLFAQHEMHSINQLLWVSAWSAGVSLALLVAGGQLGAALGFVGRHPSALAYILALSAVSTAVQLFIFYTIQQYGALHFALMMTVRQFLSIVLSCAVFRHQLSPAQWLGTALVIGGLVARGTLRGSLDRTTPRGARGLGAKAAAASGAPGKARATGSLLPLATVPVIQASVGAECAALLEAADKKDSARSIDLEARAWPALGFGTAQPDSPAELQLRRTPSGGSLVGSATAAQAAALAPRRSKLAVEG